MLKITICDDEEIIVHYVEKLIQESEALIKAIKEDKTEESVKTFSVKGKIFNIKINNIKYIESDKRVAIIHEKDIVRKIYAKLNELEELLPKQFIRCHQSYIIMVL